jgi:hypothetical protein
MRGIVEGAFQPFACTCEHLPDDCFTIRIEDLHSGKVYVVAERISMDRFASSRDISNLIAELRGELYSVQSTFGRPAMAPRTARAL